MHPDTGTTSYTLIDHQTGLCLDSNAAGNDYTHTCNGGKYQIWDVHPDAFPSTYTLVDHQTRLCLDSNAAGNSYTLSCNGGTFQNWGVLGGWPFCLADCSPPPPSPPPPPPSPAPPAPSPATPPSPAPSASPSLPSPSASTAPAASPTGHPFPRASVHVLLRCSFHMRRHRPRACSWTLRHRPLRDGQSIRLSGHLTSGSGKLLIALEGLVQGTRHWRSFWVGPTSVGGRFAHTYTFTATTKLRVYSLRAVLLAQSGSRFRATASRPVRVRVTR